MHHATNLDRDNGSAGLVVMLNIAGQLIDNLEDRVALLEDALVAERGERARVEDLLARLRAEHDTPNVTPPGPDTSDTRPHDPPRTHS